MTIKMLSFRSVECKLSTEESKILLKKKQDKKVLRHTGQAVRELM